MITVILNSTTLQLQMGLGNGPIRATYMPGSPGRSAYQVALDNGFVGTQAEWLESLKVPGPQGDEGPRGPQGPPGPSVRYVHNQPTASTEWIVNHNLGGRPAIAVLSVGGVEVDAEIIHMSGNQARVYFAAPFSGSAHCV